MAERPLWRQAFDAWNDSVGPRLEQLVRTEQFADVTARITRANQRAQRMAAELSEQVLHFWNIPSASDVTKLNNRMAAMDRELRKMAKTRQEGTDDDN